VNDLHVSAAPGGWAPPWPLVFELASALPVGSWALVGGLMVQVHALAAGMWDTRPTVDVDVLLDVMTSDATAGQLAGVLSARGFLMVEAHSRQAPAHRFRRACEIVDVLVPDHLPAGRHPRLGRRSVMSIAGGAQALARTQRVVVETARGMLAMELCSPLSSATTALRAPAFTARTSGASVIFGMPWPIRTTMLGSSCPTTRVSVGTTHSGSWAAERGTARQLSAGCRLPPGWDHRVATT
jgi:hypothetical protein